MTLACFPGSILLGRMISASTVRVQSGVWVISFHEQIVKLVFDALKKKMSLRTSPQTGVAIPQQFRMVR